MAGKSGQLGSDAGDDRKDRSCRGSKRTHDEWPERSGLSIELLSAVELRKYATAARRTYSNDASCQKLIGWELRRAEVLGQTIESIEPLVVTILSLAVWSVIAFACCRTGSNLQLACDGWRRVDPFTGLSSAQHRARIF